MHIANILADKDSCYYFISMNILLLMQA